MITLAFFIIFTLIGAMAYSDTIGYGGTTMMTMTGKISIGYDSDLTKLGNCNTLYSFCDLMAN
ncbi:MAG: hypothetical protein MJ200_00890 [Mycoplasmoidaceae bacterium]|nr:hypothetical protein [Mycoplasmoidaceae bacterium]